jgi:signal transduction histidine kinase
MTSTDTLLESPAQTRPVWSPRTWLRWWLTVRAADRDTAFRERVLRFTILAVFGVLLAVLPLTVTGNNPDAALQQRYIVTVVVGLAATMGVGAALQRGALNFTAWVMLSLFILLSLSTLLDKNYWTGLSAINILLVAIYGQLVLRGPQLWLARAIAVGLAVLPLFVPDNVPDPLTTDLTALLSPSFTAFIVTIGLILTIAMIRGMVVEFDKSLAEIQKLNAELEARVAERTQDLLAIATRNAQLLEETRAAKDAADEASKVKSAFLASMSHELRTPLNAIINFSKFLKKGIPGPVNDEQTELIGSIADSGQHLLNLINDVLDMSKIESGSLTLYVEQGLNLREIVELAASYAQPLLADKPVAMRLNLPDALPPIAGDRKRLLQIFLNILSNACKFTESGEITISLAHNAGRAHIAIRDSGPGIAPQDAESVFVPFKQTDSGLRQGGGGTGLGMPISLKLVEAHQGRLWFESQLGRGTTFFVELPLQAA